MVDELDSLNVFFRNFNLIFVNLFKCPVVRVVNQFIRYLVKFVSSLMSSQLKVEELIDTNLVPVYDPIRLSNFNGY